MDRRPNILFLMSDEHRADVTGYEGNSVIRTPVLDKLARTGVVFKNAYTPSPICIPSRQAMMAGQLPKTCCCREYGEDLTPGYMTFAKRFSQYAYSTVVFGKLHHLGQDQMQGWSQRPCGDAIIGADYIEGRIESEYDKYTRKLKWSDVKEVQRAGIGCHKKDDYYVEGAKRFIEDYFNNSYYDRESKDRPLLLKVSLTQPHYPYLANESKFKYYLNRVMPFLDQKVSEHPFLSRRQVIPEIDASEREIRRATAAYYSMVESLDDCFGKVIEALEYVGQNLDDWIIIYTSDHGEMLGEHGIWEKQKFYEASVRVPLIIRYPKKYKGGITIQENVNLCDLFATLCDLCEIPIPNGLDSRSMLPLLKGETHGWNNETLSQFGLNNLMIKRDDLKYQYYGKDMPEVLFDLKKDPGEEFNCVDDTEYSDKLEEFRKRRSELGYGPYACESYINVGYGNR